MGKTEISAQAKTEFTLTPKLSIKLPTAPRRIFRLMKTSLFSPLKKIFKKGTYRIKRNVLIIGLRKFSRKLKDNFVASDKHFGFFIFFLQ